LLNTRDKYIMNILFIAFGVAGLILINPFIGLLITVALIPQALIPALGNMFLGAFTMVTPIKLVGGLTFISTLGYRFNKNNREIIFNNSFTRFFAFFVVWVFISGFTQPSPFTRENLTVFTSFAILGFIILSLVTNMKRFKLVLWAGFISIFVISINSVFYYLSYKSVVVRIAGSSYGPNYFAIALLPFLGVGFYNIFVERNKILKIFSVLIVLAISCALVVTSSRGGLVGLAGMLLVAAFQAKKKFKAGLFVLLCVVIMMNVMPESVKERFSKTKIEENYIGDDTIDSTTRRFRLAEAGWKMFLANPLFGVGVGNYYWECREYADNIHAGRAHNMYIEIMAELGIIGAVLFFAIIYSLFKTLKKIVKMNILESNYAQGIYIGLVGFLIAAIFLHAQQDKGFWFVMFMTIALERIACKGIESN